MLNHSVRSLHPQPLPGHYYTDAGMYAHELETLWRSCWQWVGRIENIPNCGDGFDASLVGEGTVRVVRLEGGELAVQSPGGKPLPMQAETWGGFVFVRAEPEGESLLEYLAGVPEYLGQYSCRWEDLRLVHRFIRDEPTNWKFQVENFVEDYHFSIVHATTLSPLYDVQKIGTIPTGRHINIPVPYNPEKPSDARTLKRWKPGITSYQGFIFPNITYGTSPMRVFFSRYIPLGPTSTRLEAWILQTPDQFAREPFVAESGSGKVGEEDAAVCNLLQLGVNSRAYTVHQLAEEHELGVAHFWDAVREAIET